MTEAEIRAEWKGLWKCERCGQFWDGDDLGNHGNTGGSHYSTMAGAYFAGYALCSGKVVPLDRRAPDSEKQELEEDAAFRVWQNQIREAGGKWKRNVEPAPFGAATKESRDERR